MTHSIFGWSYPPGCSGPPDIPEGPCEVCGMPLDDCICPECSTCGTQGDPKCYLEHGLVRNQDQIDGRAKLDRQIKEIREMDEAADRMREQYLAESAEGDAELFKKEYRQC